MKWTPRFTEVRSTPSLLRRMTHATVCTMPSAAIPWCKASRACPSLWVPWLLPCAQQHAWPPHGGACKTVIFGCSTTLTKVARTPMISNWCDPFFGKANCFVIWHRLRIGMMSAVQCLAITTLQPPSAGKRRCKFRPCASCAQVCWTKMSWPYCAPTHACQTACGAT